MRNALTIQQITLLYIDEIPKEEDMQKMKSII